MTINDTIFNTDILTVINTLKTQLQANGVSLFYKSVDSGSDLMVCCPYHKQGQERRPSAGIRKSDGLFHCLACGETHFLPEVISYALGYNDAIGKQGWLWLTSNFASVSVENRADINLDLSREVVTKEVTYVSEEELDSYRYVHPYMYERKLTDDVIELFDIGYDKHTECITFPVRDKFGRTLFIARRSVKTKYFNYPSGAEKPLYGLYEYLSTRKQYFLGRCSDKQKLAHYMDSIIVCESMLDALHFWAVGRFAVALNGLGNELQFEQLRELPCRHLILCTDMDEKGLSARKTIRQKVKNKVISEYFLPNGRKDAGECTDEELRNLIDYL